MRRSIFFLFFVIILSAVGIAHLDAGEDVLVGNIALDFGYSPADPKPYEPVFLNVNVLENASEKLVNVSHVWVRISSQNTIYFTGSLHALEGNVNMLFPFPRSGEYQILVRVYNDSTVLAEHTFEVTVQSKSSVQALWIPVIVIIVLLVIVACLLLRKRK